MQTSNSPGHIKYVSEDVPRETQINQVLLKVDK